MAKYPDVTAGQTEACINRMGGWENFLSFIGGQGKIVFEAVTATIESLLTLVAEIKLAAQPRFVARDHFKVDMSAEAVVRITYLSPDFEQNFLDKVEEATPEASLAVRRLEKDLLDKEIQSELGGAGKEETSLSQFHACLARQSAGQAGELLVNGYANIFYIRDAKGKLWAVRARWYAGLGGWDVYAHSVESPYGWSAGHRVVSRN